MTGPLNAGEPLVPNGRRRGGGTPPPPPGSGAGRPRRRGSWIGRLFGALFGLGALMLIVGGVAGVMLWQRFSTDLPSVDGLRNYEPALMSRVYASNGRLIAELATQRRIFVPYSAIPDLVKAAFISAEDQNFWIHPGVDPLAIIRAGVYDLLHFGNGRRPLGASTITQQVAKNMLLGNHMNLTRKIEEAILALRMERVLSKQRILEIYLNEIYLGEQAYGIAAASQAYFGKPLDRLTLAEDAMLAALPKAPHNYDPYLFPEAAKARRDWVLDRMADDGAITRAQARAAQAQPLLPAQRRAPPPIPGADWFSEQVHRDLVAQFGNQLVLEGGLTVRTSLDPRLQTEAEKAVHDGLMAYDRKMGGWRGPVVHLAGADLANWPAALAKLAVPDGMLSDWRLAVVLSEGRGGPRIGWLDPASDPKASPRPVSGRLTLGGEVWRHPMTPAGYESAAYRGVAEMVHPGDVVMVQPEAPAQGRSGPTLAVLRQIPQVQGALVTLDPNSGRVLAMVGGWSFNASQFNRATQAQRQPGSSFKPMVYLTALEQGYSPSSRFLNAPIVVNLGAAGVWRPHNYEDNFGGPTSLQVALEQSLNLVTLRVARRIGMASIAKTAEAFGMVDKMPEVLPAALGAVDTTVLREAGAYASLDEGGRRVVPTLIDSVQDPQGHVVWRPSGLACACSDPATPPVLKDERSPIADPASVFQVVTMMQGVVLRGTGVTVGKGLNRPIAGKTGTTQNFTDAWFAGFTPQLVTVVWVGRDAPAPLGINETGASVAGPIWHQFMMAALKGRPALQFPQPPGVTMAAWDSRDGRVTSAFKPGQVPGASTVPTGGTAVADDGSGGTATGLAGGGGAPGTGATPASNAASPGGVDSSLGGLY